MSRIIRPTLAAIGILGAIFAPPWLTLICMALLAFRYPALEVLFMGVLMDFLWLPSAVHWENFTFWSSFFSLPLFTLAALALLWGLEPLRKELLVS